MEDYYKILELNEGASQDDIKAAYRKLAKKHHPDLNKGNASSEAMFKKINEANDTLGDPQKRAQYDQQRKFGQGGPQGNPFQGFHGGFPGADFHFNFGGGGHFDDIINQFFGQGFGRGAQQAPRNRDFQFNLNITLEEAFVGKSMPIAFDVNGQQTSITVTIPAGIDNGSRLRFQGHGDRSVANQPPGDLYVTVIITDHPTFQRHGPHLHTNLKIDAISAILGLQQNFKSIDGSELQISVPAGAQVGSTLRLQGHGMPAHNNARHRGDLYIHIEIDIPSNLTAQQQDLLRQVQNLRSGGKL
jgi:curved DNA-binding protein